MPQPRAAPGKSDRAVELSVLLGGASKSLWWCSSGDGNPSGIEGPPGYGNRRRLKFHQYSTSGLQKLSLLSLPKTPFSLNQLNLKGSGIVCRCHVHNHLLAVLFDSTRIQNPRSAAPRDTCPPPPALSPPTVQRLRLGIADRLLWVWLSRLWNGWRSALVIVKPETVIAWHRQGFRLYWRWKSRHRVGRPSVSREVIDLIYGSTALFVGKRAVEKPAPWKSPKAGLSYYARKSRRDGRIPSFSTAPTATISFFLISP